MIERILCNNEVIAIIIRAQYNIDGISFFTPDDFSQQLGYMNRPEGYLIDPHIHNPVSREIVWTQEVLFIKTGEVRVDFYSGDKIYLESRILFSGDVILLSGGGHGLKMLKKSEIIEVKQGPYCGELDKTRFATVKDSEVKFSK